MESTGPYLLVLLLLSIVLIVGLIAWRKVHPFLAIVLATYVFGLGAMALGPLLGTPEPVIEDLDTAVGEGFGGILAGIGLVILFGTIIGKILERTGAAVALADGVLRLIGEKRPALAMSVIGWTVSIPVFCDSGYVVMSPLQRSIAKRTGTSSVVLGTSLATGLYASHTFVPPTPGPIAAAGNLGIGAQDLIWVILAGLVVSSVVAGAGLLWATRATRGLVSDHADAQQTFEDYKAQFPRIPSLGRALTPILVPIGLMALGSVAAFPSGDGTLVEGFLGETLAFIGTPVVALLLGVLLALALLPERRDEETLTRWVSEGIVDAAIIITITGAGGAFGAVIRATPIPDYIQSLVGDGSGLTGVTALLVLFTIAALLKTAQGSTTAALVITSTIAAPLLPALGLDGMLGAVPIGQVLAVMAIGAGAMVVSHVNDSYFWVVSQFSGMSVTTAYRAHTAATLAQGLTGIALIVVLGVVLL
jgi:GntP family gluconate:H+ symporter